jgi:NitT/TauT family transport system substrate-binding protein
MTDMLRRRRRGAMVLSAFVAFTAYLVPATSHADDALRVGKAFAGFTLSPVNIGVERGIFRKHGLDVTVTDFGGDAKLVQAITAGDIDIGVGGGTDMAFTVKGAPMLAVASVVGPPLDLAIIVPYSSPLRTLDDLKGRRIAISAPGSLTDWLMAELIRRKGWTSGDVTTVALGDMSARIAAIRIGQIDASWASPGTGFQLEEKKEGRVLDTAAAFVRDFITEALFASDRVTNANPKVVTAFIAGWLDSVAFMRSNKAETVTLMRKVTGFSDSVENREYEQLMPAFTSGRFDTAALVLLKSSFVPLGLLDHEPDMARLYTDKFLP